MFNGHSTLALVTTGSWSSAEKNLQRSKKIHSMFLCYPIFQGLFSLR